MRKMIAIDFGLKRVGVAWHFGGITLPLPAINFNSVSQVASEINAILVQKSPKILVFGIVREELQSTLEAVISKLNFSGEIKFVDENLSSAEAEKFISGRKKSKKLRKDGTLDSLSAMIILERYLG